MIATKNDVQQAINDLSTGLQAQIDTVFLRADRAARAATDAAERAALASRCVAGSSVDVALLKESLERAHEHARRQDNLIAMLLDYLNAEVVYEPERMVTLDGYITEHEPAQQFIASKKRKARR